MFCRRILLVAYCIFRQVQNRGLDAGLWCVRFFWNCRGEWGNRPCCLTCHMEDRAALSVAYCMYEDVRNIRVQCTQQHNHCYGGTV